MATQSRNVERVIGRLATSAKGIVTRGELLDAHVTRDEIHHRLVTGSLLPEYPGVYRVGGRLSRRSQSTQLPVLLHGCCKGLR